MKITTVLASAGLALAFTGPAVADDRNDDDDVELREVPAAARAMIEREARGGEIEDIERKTRPDGTVYYEVEIEKADAEWELHVSADGKLLKRERD